MRLTQAGDDIDRRALSVLEGRLQAHSPRPVAVAVSGGGDSLALLLIAADWAKATGRALLALNVDHGLQPESPGWAAVCEARATALGVPFQGLRWTGSKPLTGVPAAARAARHALLANAAREAGARVLLMGHTADDVIEARRMRAEGSSTPDPRPWSPSPAWPEGRGLFLLRPLLEVRRGAIRDWLADRQEPWIDDPANEDLRYARARARRSKAEPAISPLADDTRLGVLAQAVEPLAGGLTIDRRTLRRAEFADAQRLTAVAALCAAGTARPPLRERLRVLTGRLVGDDPFTAGLAGARIVADRKQVAFFREAGEAARGGLLPLALVAGRSGVWDGRFEIASDHAVEIVALQGHARRLNQAQTRALAAIPAAARPALPWTEDGSPMLGDLPGIRCENLAHGRMLAACGIIRREPL